ncbi:MAG: aldo/keto reductase [Rhizobiales bacterium]|nr:aldo/keto reductase [Hyphomicrobiales bacterium]NRB14329.1 aldo/keto reductase [Hyphomicrobiales bacterium]
MTDINKLLKPRTIADTNVSVSRISLGCAGIGNLYNEVTEQATQDLLAYAWQEGIRYFDTAPHYGRGLSETRLGEFLKTTPRDEALISTKVGRVLRPGQKQLKADGFINPLANDVHYDYSADGILESLEGSYKRLGVDKVDIVYVHDIGSLTHGENNQKHLNDLLSTGLPMLETLKKQGIIGAYGLGVNECEVCVDVLKLHNLDVILLAGRWTLLDNSAEKELLPLCLSGNTSLVLGGIFNSGILATGPTKGAHYDYEVASEEVLQRTRLLEEHYAKQNTPLATAAMQFGLSKQIVSSVLIGTAKKSSLERNLNALNIANHSYP